MPEELWTGCTPSLAHLRIFGCFAYAHIPKELRQKLDPKSEKLLFVGYCEDSKGYCLMDPKTGQITKSRDVIFLENSESENGDRTPSPATLLEDFNEEGKDSEAIQTDLLKTQSKRMKPEALFSVGQRGHINQSKWKIMSHTSPWAMIQQTQRMLQKP